MAGCANWHSGMVEGHVFAGSTPAPATKFMWTDSQDGKAADCNSANTGVRFSLGPPSSPLMVNS